VEEPSALERLPVHLPEVPESREIHLDPPVHQVHQVHQVHLGTLGIGRFPALEKIPYVIAPFNE
jgi:hypothetical protein